MTTVKPVYRDHSKEPEAVDLDGQLTFIYNKNYVHYLIMTGNETVMCYIE